jgi:molybdopterin-guanine dinucleotide biosynthesis protein A
MTEKANIPVVILSGGLSSRFGSNKALAKLDGKRLVDQLIERLSLQTSAPIVINAPDENTYGLPNNDFIADEVGDRLGPLAGIHAALTWAEQHGYQSVCTTPVDTPYVPQNFVSIMTSVRAPVIASFAGKYHPIHGASPVSLKPSLETGISSGMRAVMSWVDTLGATVLDFAEFCENDPFININRPTDIAVIEEQGGPDTSD